MLPLTVTPCIPSEIYPCSTRSAMGVDGVINVQMLPMLYKERHGF